MGLQEVILCATAPQPSGSTSGLASGLPGAFVLHDLQTSNVLSSFKQTSSSPHCSAFVETKDGQGGVMLAAQSDKALLNVYNFQKDQIALKVVLPEKLTCLALDQKARYCAGGTAHGRIYLWEVASGILYNSWDAHYRQVNVLKFTYDGTVLISASEDSGISVWSVSKLVDDDLQNDHPLPQFTLSDHTLPVTDIACGLGPFPMCRILTGSLDHTVKLWDLATQSLITTFHFPKPIRGIVCDITERLFFASSPDGSLYQMNLFRERELKNKGGPFIEAVGGAGASDVVRFDTDSTSGGKRLIEVDQPVTTLCISLNGSLLLIGTATGLIHVYDIASHQLLRTISTHKGLSISFLATMLKPPDLVGHISLSLNVDSIADARDMMPVRPVAIFHRMRDANARELHEVSMMLPITGETPQTGRCDYDYPESEFQRDMSFFVQPTEAAPLASSTSRVAELEVEVEQLKEQLGKAKGVNDAMWKVVVQRALKGKLQSASGTEEDVEMDEEPKVVERRNRKDKSISPIDLYSNMGFSQGAVLASCSFFIGVLFICFFVDYRILYKEITEDAIKDGFQFYATFFNAPPAIKALLHGFIGVGLTALVAKLLQWDESAVFFDGSSLAAYLFAISVYVAVTIPCLRTIVTPAETDSMSDRIEAMRILSAGNTIMILILGAILGLQGGQEYARRMEQKELAKLEKAEKEEAARSTGEKDKRE